MTDLKIEKRKLINIIPHQNADRLEIGFLEDCNYQFVIGKSEFQIGSDIIYFPIDSVLPEKLIIFLKADFIRQYGRVKTVKLRGEISQGFCVSVEKIEQYLNQKITDEMDLTKLLEVEKYEPELKASQSYVNLQPLPYFVTVFDVENSENFPSVVEYLKEKPVVISEKLEGMNYGISINNRGKIFVNQRRFCINENVRGSNFVWKATDKYELTNFISNFQKTYFPNSDLTLRGELIGISIQGNYYGLKNQQIYFYDICVDGKYINIIDFKECFEQAGIKIVPIIFEGLLKDYIVDGNLRDLSNGKSLINSKKLREGIVIRSIENEYIRIKQFSGRAMLKQRSPEYLAKEN